MVMQNIASTVMVKITQRHHNSAFSMECLHEHTFMTWKTSKNGLEHFSILKNLVRVTTSTCGGSVRSSCLLSRHKLIILHSQDPEQRTTALYS